MLDNGDNSSVYWSAEAELDAARNEWDNVQEIIPQFSSNGGSNTNVHRNLKKAAETESQLITVTEIIQKKIKRFFQYNFKNQH